MSVLERTGEIGVMRAMGVSRPRALGLFLVESIFIGLLGSAFGVALGSAGAWYLETYGGHCQLSFGKARFGAIESHRPGFSRYTSPDATRGRTGLGAFGGWQRS
jgi:ABC-type lipoprotein release transport system permease subunit